MSTNAEITSIINKTENISQLIPLEYLQTPPVRFDFSKANPEIQDVDMSSASDLQTYIDRSLTNAGRTWGIGGYNEDRFFYEKSELFRSGNEYRSIHLGIDIWLPAGTAIYAPLDATVHSFHYNDKFLDYGPTIVLQHDTGSVIFWTLYGHLSMNSLTDLAKGKTIASGKKLADLGDVTVNGSWPPHLHFQIIGDMMGKEGDYPAVVVPSEREKFLNICPNPEMLLTKFMTT